MPTVVHVLFVIGFIIGLTEIKKYFSEGSYSTAIIAVIATVLFSLLWSNMAAQW